MNKRKTGVVHKIQISLLSVLVMSSVNIVAQDFGSTAARKLQVAEFAISHLYVDHVDEDKLVESAIVGMLKELDPHSTYSDAEEVKKMNEPLQGNFEGIGVQFNMIEDTLFVIQPVSNGPSEKVGILAGDRIVAVNDTAIAGVKMSTEEIMSRLRGPKNTQVNLKVVRRGLKEPLQFTVARDKIPIYSLDASYMIRPKVGYIRINRFGATTAEEFETAILKLKKLGMNDLIVDVQGNGGGYLNAAIDLSNEFLDTKDLIVYTQGRSAQRSDFFARGTGNFKKGRLIVLVDEFSASASEILSGAIQDWDRGVIVGRRTFGKGLVQRPIDLPDGSIIRLTVARYYTPAGRSIQKPYQTETGETNPSAYHNDLIDRYNRGEMLTADSIHFPDSLMYKTARLGRTVYGGGGIMPDYFVPIDTTRYTDYHRMIAARGLILNTSMKYVENNRTRLLNQYKNFNNFNKSFTVNADLLDMLREAADKSGVEFNEQQYETSLPFIKSQLKGVIARDLWEMSEYYQVINETNESVQSAVKLLEDGGYEKILSN